MKSIPITSKNANSVTIGGGGGGGGALECNITGRCPFSKNLHNLLGKKFACQYPVSELSDYKNSHYLFRNS